MCEQSAWEICEVGIGIINNLTAVCVFVSRIQYWFYILFSLGTSCFLELPVSVNWIFQSSDFGSLALLKPTGALVDGWKSEIDQTTAAVFSDLGGFTCKSHCHGDLLGDLDVCGGSQLLGTSGSF